MDSPRKHRVMATLLSALLFFQVTAATLSSSSASTATSSASVTSAAASFVYEAHGIAFSSALLIEASLRYELSHPTVVPALPNPKGLNLGGEYKAVARLATAPLPPIQVFAGSSDLDQIAQEILVEADKRSTALDSLTARQASPLRIMIVGDSISNGQQGDYTWRYRLWQWLESQTVKFQYVGPYNGTFQSTCALATGPQAPTQPPPLYDSSSSSNSTPAVSGGYATSVPPSFTMNNDAHFSVWGRALATDQGLIQSVLQGHMADMILLELGFNDMGFFYSDCYGTINSLQKFITNARAANPNIMFAIANVPQRTYIRADLTSNISTYNQILPGYLQQWSTAQSPIHLIDFEGNYACGTNGCPAGYDGLHPNAWGEFQIAQAFSKGLIAGFGIGSTPLAIPSSTDPSVIRSIGTPGNFQVFSSPQGVSATWDQVYGAYSYNVSVSINGGGSGFSPTSTSVNRWDSQWPLQGWSYSISVQALCGDQSGPFTSTEVATAEPQLAPPPQNVNVQPTSDGFTVSWTPPTGNYTSDIVEYNIIYWDTDPTDCNFVTGAAFTSSPGTIANLLTGRSYLVAPVTWNQNGQGLPYIAHNVVPGSGTPPVPSNLQAVSNDAASVHLSWTGSSSAAGYEVFIRNATGGPYISLANTSQTCSDDYFLYPGTYTYEFCVAAYNGNEESARGPGVIPPQPNSAASSATCAPAPSWCPSYGQPPNVPSVGGCAGCGGNGCPSGSSACVSPTNTIPGGSGPSTFTSTLVSGGTTETTTSGGHTYTTVVGGTTRTTTVTSGGGQGGSPSTFTSTYVSGGTTETITTNGHTTTTVVGGVTHTTTGVTTGSGVVGAQSYTTTYVVGGSTFTTVIGGNTYTAVSGGSTVVTQESGTPTSSPYTITSTQTTVPPGVTYFPYTGPSPITDDTWITTTNAQGSSTIVPIILPCPTCEPLVVIDLPPIKGVIFSWPFPTLPSFDTPCIKIFGIHISGDCPPKNDGSPESPQHSFTPSVSHSNSPSSSCASQSVRSNCQIECGVSTVPSASTLVTDCPTTTCQTTMTGCGVTGTTTTVQTTYSCPATVPTVQNPTETDPPAAPSTNSFVPTGSPSPTTMTPTGSPSPTTMTYTGMCDGDEEGDPYGQCNFSVPGQSLLANGACPSKAPCPSSAFTTSGSCLVTIATPLGSGSATISCG